MGPQGDAGLTGRKIIIDTYGGWGAHGGGAFSGKDPTKVDRSAAYLCRQMAKSVVKSGLCKRALVQLSYAIGVAKPLSLFVETYGTQMNGLTAEDITKVVKIAFDCRPGAIAQSLQLREPKYQVTAAYGHFGRKPYTENGMKFFEWENPADLTRFSSRPATTLRSGSIRQFNHYDGEFTLECRVEVRSKLATGRASEVPRSQVIEETELSLGEGVTGAPFSFLARFPLEDPLWDEV